MQDDKFCNISTRDFNFCWKKRVKHKVQAIAHLPMNEKTARASENAQAHAEGQEGREAITGKGGFSTRGASAAGRELQHCQDTHEIPQVPRAAEKQGMLFPWHRDNLLSCWHVKNPRSNCLVSSSQFNKRCFSTCVKSWSHAVPP